MQIRMTTFYFLPNHINTENALDGVQLKYMLYSFPIVIL